MGIFEEIANTPERAVKYVRGGVTREELEGLIESLSAPPKRDTSGFLLEAVNVAKEWRDDHPGEIPDRSMVIGEEGGAMISLRSAVAYYDLLRQEARLMWISWPPYKGI